MLKKVLLSLFLYISFSCFNQVCASLDDYYIPDGWREVRNNLETKIINKKTKHGVYFSVMAVSEAFKSLSKGKQNRDDEYFLAKMAGNENKCKKFETKPTYQYMYECEVYPETLTSFMMVRLLPDRVYAVKVICDATGDVKINECELSRQIIDSLEVF